MAWTQSDIDALKAAIGSGVTIVSHSGRTVTYRSLQEMTRILGLMEAEVSGKAAPRFTKAAFRR